MLYDDLGNDWDSDLLATPAHSATAQQPAQPAAVKDVAGRLCLGVKNPGLCAALVDAHAPPLELHRDSASDGSEADEQQQGPPRPPPVVVAGHPCGLALPGLPQIPQGMPTIPCLNAGPLNPFSALIGHLRARGYPVQRPVNLPGAHLADSGCSPFTPPTVDLDALQRQSVYASLQASPRGGAHAPTPSDLQRMSQNSFFSAYEAASALQPQSSLNTESGYDEDMESASSCNDDDSEATFATARTHPDPHALSQFRGPPPHGHPPHPHHHHKHQPHRGSHPTTAGSRSTSTTTSPLPNGDHPPSRAHSHKHTHHHHRTSHHHVPHHHGLHPAVEAFRNGSLGFAFSGGGFFFPYAVSMCCIYI